MLDRRRFMLGLGAFASGFGSHAARGASPRDPGHFDELELEVPGERLAKRCLLLTPRGHAPVRRLLVLFHGLGETTSEALGIRAWADRYGLLNAAARLASPPVARTLKGVPLLTDARLTELNAELGHDPFHGLAVACPYTPNVFHQPSTPEALERYAAWIVEGVLPECRRRLALPAGAPAVGVDGVSLGGFVSLEVFLRRPEAFGAAGALQPAIGEGQAETYAERFRRVLDRVGARPLRIATTAWDGERKASERLVKRLRAHGVDVTLVVSPGAHDQRFLREAGTLELLYYYDRTLPRGPGAT